MTFETSSGSNLVLICSSGGQQRRVSFAAALLHDPELLILDEPTVGVDPLLRQSIWDHLIEITKDGSRTVIITTHYIEETRQAGMVSVALARWEDVVGRHRRLAVSSGSFRCPSCRPDMRVHAIGARLPGRRQKKRMELTTVN